ncbi:MAG: DNA primase [Alphaproteobacteria bacterium]|nr:DNA primase [Alphaproteobacteria bacterium]
MSFPPDFLDEIRTRVPVSSVVARSVKLQRRGREFIGLSPFTSEKTPSFTVNDQKGFYHCFSSGEHGDVFTFLMKTQSLPFPEAVEQLAEEAGLEVPKATPEEAQRAERRTTLQDAVEMACQFYEQKLRSPEGRVAYEYLRDRGLSDEIIKKYRLGYAPNGNALKSMLSRDSIPEDVAIEARMLSPGQDGRSSFDFFRDRVMFPICDARGRPVAFGGRVLGDGGPKYLNSPETPLFHKGHLVYAFSQARKEASDKAEIIVAEGYMDVIALSQAGINNAVAPLGTALTETQIALLWRIAPEPILCFDGDAAGRQAALRAADRCLPLLEPGRSLRFALLPAGQDPDDLIKSDGREAMRDVLDAAIPLSEIVWRRLLEGRRIDTPERRAALEKDADDLARMINESSVQSQYRRHMRDRVYDLFRSQAGPAVSRNVQGRYKAPVTAQPEAKPRQLDATGVRQRILLATLISHPDLLDHVEERLGAMPFADSRLDSLRQSALMHLSQSPNLEFEGLKAHLAGLGFADELKKLMSSEVYVHAGFARPDAELQDATIGWDHTFSLCQRADLEADVRRAADDLINEPTDSAFAVFRSLRTEGQASDENGGV